MSRDTTDEGSFCAVTQMIERGTAGRPSMALALRHLGVGCVVVDKHEGPMDFPRGRGITVRTMELMRRWGLEAALRAAGLPASEVAVFVGDDLLAPTFDRHVTSASRPSMVSPSAPLICFQNATEVVLRDAAVAAGADVRYGWELVDAVDDGDGVTASLVERASGHTRTLRAPWLVAADGAYSPTRDRLGVETVRTRMSTSRRNDRLSM